MTIQKIRILLGGIIIVGAGILWYAFPEWYVSPEKSEKGKSNPPEESIATTSPEGVITSPEGLKYGYEATKATSTSQSLPKGVKIPDLNLPVVIPANFLQDVKVSATARIAKIVASLKENPANAVLWAELGLERNGIEDYEGAKDAYEYALALSPYNSVVVENLGVLYGYYLKDPKKAEAYFLKSIELGPESTYRYLRLFEFYKYVLKDNAKAKAILEQGLKVSPGEPSFKALLETL